MKTFQKIALVSAIAAAPFAAQADLTPMDDALMGDTTGQAGVTIEIDLGAAGIKIGEVIYTDTATATDTDGGSVSLDNINIGLTGTLVQTIDVDASGDLKMEVSAPGSLTISAGNNAADTAGMFSALNLQATDGSESEVINNLDLAVTLGKSTTTIKNLGDAGSLGLGALSGAGVTGTYASMESSMAIQMTAKAKITDMNLGMFGYTNAQATKIVGDKVAAYEGGYAAAVAADTAAGAGTTTNADAFVAANGATVDTNGDGVFDAATATALTNQVATGSAIQVTGVTVTDANAADGMFSVDQTIWAVGGDASQAGSDAGVYIQMGAMNLDVGVAGIAIGGSSIGSVQIKGLEMAGLTQRIYGH